VDEFHEELWVIGTDGSGERRLVSVDNLSAIDPQAMAVVPATFEWIPGTHLLAFNTRQVVEGPGSIMYEDLHLANADSGQIQTLLAPGHGGQFFPAPDGRQIAVTSPNSLSLVNVDGTNLRQDVLDYAPITTYSEYRYYAQPVWQANSSSLLIAIPPQDPLAIPLPPTSLWQVPIDGTKAKQIGKIATGPFFGMDVFYSPDRSHILFLDSSGNPDENLKALHIARQDGSQDAVYTTATALTIHGWAPDSQHFTFSLGSPGVLQLGQIGGKFQAVLDTSSNLVDFSWIDDERFIYVLSGADGYEIHLGNLQGQDVLLGITQAFQSTYDFAR
jgi:Tol biopolymer transport system component